MKLIDQLVDAWQYERDNPPEPYKHVQETPDELYLKVTNACRDRARGGCSTLSFHWDYVWGETEEEWNAQHMICLEVVRRLEEEGLVANCTGEFPEKYIDRDDVVVRPEGEHYISVTWTHALDKRGNLNIKI